LACFYTSKIHLKKPEGKPVEKERIKFSGKIKSEFISELRKKVDEYFDSNKISKYGNLSLTAKTIVMFLMYFIPYFLMMSGIIKSIEGVLLCWIIIGVGKAGVGMTVMHDANHRSFSKRQSVNRWLGKSLYLLGGFPPNWQYQHNTMHHGFTNIDGYDEDIDPGGYLRLSPHKPLYKIHKFQHIYGWFLYGLMTLSWVTTKDFVQLGRYKRDNAKLNTKRTYNHLFRILIFSKILYFTAFIILPLVVLPFSWPWVLLFFLAMHFTTGLILSVIFQTAHVIPDTKYPLPGKEGTIENNWAIHQLQTTSDFSPRNKVLSWCIGGLNYQIEHHLFPNISHIHYPKLSQLVRETAQKYQITYHVQNSFFKAIQEHAKMLKNLGRAPVVT
jgi:linoleoyl-CoA desaturase